MIRWLFLLLTVRLVVSGETFLPVESNDTSDQKLVASTIDGRLIALSANSGRVLWTIAESPLLKAPLVAQAGRFLMPDPRDGTLYVLGVGERQLKKLPLTIPQLVQASPLRSSDGVMYAGRKRDEWFSVDPDTGEKLQTLNDDSAQLDPKGPPKVCPVDSEVDQRQAIYLSRTEYLLTMFDEKSRAKKWNATYIDYSSNILPSQFIYNLEHYSSSFDGHLVTVDSKTGQVLWQQNFKSLVVAIYLLNENGLNRLPLRILGKKTLEEMMMPNFLAPIEFPSIETTPSNDWTVIFNERREKRPLYPAIYVGESKDGLYAVPSLVDDKTVTFVAKPKLPLIAGPKSSQDSENENLGQNFVAIDYELASLYNNQPEKDILLLGYHKAPALIEAFNLYHTTNLLPLIIAPPLLPFSHNENLRPPPQAIENQNEKTPTRNNNNKNQHSATNSSFYESYISQDFLKLIITNIITCVVIIVVTVLLLRKLITKTIIMHSQSLQVSNMSNKSGNNVNNSSGQNFSSDRNGNILNPILIGDDSSATFRVGKITFNTLDILGRGCEGTVVYRGSFDGRDVAVKRVVSDFFNLADREVDLLRASDFHPNVIRYFCMEADSQFRYIALELCWATLNDYVEKAEIRDECQMSIMNMLEQATLGLHHLHSLKIVHRDVKPQNLLLSKSCQNGKVKVLISDFGLCKKLGIGRNSFSKRSGFAGTDGWIAPEILCSKTATCSVDIFSLGCVFYFMLTNGKHPFGDSFRRQANILAGDFSTSDLSGNDAETWRNLIDSMLAQDATKRPMAGAVLKHPAFWTKARMLAFFQDVSDRVDKEDHQSPVVQQLEKGGWFVVNRDWRQHICDGLLTDLKSRRTYRGNSVRDLLRAMRNKKNHFRELSDEVKELVGTVPEELVAYFASKFPSLLVHVYEAMRMCQDEPLFRHYYDAE